MVWFWNRQPNPPQPVDDATLRPSAPTSVNASEDRPSASSSITSSLPKTASPVVSPLPNQDVRTSSSAATRRQLGLFVGGWVFFALSLRVARRAVARKYRAIYPKYYQPNTQTLQTFSGPLEAMEALYVATINVASFGMIMAGGTMYAFDIEGLEDLRNRLRSRLYRDEEGAAKTAEVQDAQTQDTVDVMSAIVQHEEEERARREQIAGRTISQR